MTVGDIILIILAAVIFGIVFAFKQAKHRDKGLKLPESDEDDRPSAPR